MSNFISYTQLKFYFDKSTAAKKQYICEMMYLLLLASRQ